MCSQYSGYFHLVHGVCPQFCAPTLWQINLWLGIYAGLPPDLKNLSMFLLIQLTKCGKMPLITLWE